MLNDDIAPFQTAEQPAASQRLRQVLGEIHQAKQVAAGQPPLDGTLVQLQRTIFAQSQQIAEFERWLPTLEQTITELAQRCEGLETRVRELEAENAALQPSDEAPTEAQA